MVEVLKFSIFAIYGIITGVLILVAYNKGLDNGQRLSKGEKVAQVVEKESVVEISPKEQQYLDNLQKSWANIDNYNGTGEGQADIG